MLSIRMHLISSLQTCSVLLLLEGLSLHEEPALLNSLTVTDKSELIKSESKSSLRVRIKRPLNYKALTADPWILLCPELAKAVLSVCPGGNS